MKNSIPSPASNEVDMSQIRTLHKWLSYNRYTIFGYGGGVYLPWGLILFVMTILAVVFAPYMIYVLYRNGKRGWVVFFGVIVGIPLIFAFLHTGNDVLN